MDCRDVEELLPWMLNGTLSEAEQAAVGEHLTGCAGCRLAQAETAFVSDAVRQHVTAAGIVALAYERSVGEMSLAELDAHLTACPQCAEELELVRVSRGLETEGREEAANGNASFLALPIDQKGNASPTAGDARVLPFVAPISSGQAVGWRYAALAACLTLMLAGSGWIYYSWRSASLQEARWSAENSALRERLAAIEAELQREQRKATAGAQPEGQTRQEIEQLSAQVRDAEARLAEHQAAVRKEQTERGSRSSAPPAQPQANVLALDVFPLGLTTRAGDATPNQLEIPRHVHSVTLILNTSSATDYPSYVIELRRAGGPILWNAQGVRRSSGSDFTINLPTHLLTSGSYLIHIYGLQAGTRTKIETYQIQVK